MTLLKTLTILALCFISRVNCILNLLSSSKSKIASLKAEILTLSSSVERGLTETPQDRQRMCELFESLEKCNPRSDTLSSPYLNGTWVLRYTTSDAILGRKKAAFGVFQGGKSKVGEILQSLDTKNLRAENAEVVNYFGLNINRKVSSELTPISPSEVAVQFKQFTIGPLSFPAPSSFKGRLKITYVDPDFRLSRGDKGNIFVLTK